MARKKDSGGLGPLSEQAINTNLLGRTDRPQVPAADKAPAAQPETARPPAGKARAPKRVSKTAGISGSPPVVPAFPPLDTEPEPAVVDATSTPGPTLCQFLLWTGGAGRQDS